ncbi:MAG: hypothetical protein ACJ739_11285 [Acidimicrobiales bacterium]
MTDELDVLRHERDVIDPDPQFRADLMERLRHSMVLGSDVETGHPHLLDLDAPPSAEVRPRSHEGRTHRLRRWIAVAAAIVLIAVGVAMIQDRDREPNVATGTVEGDDQALADAALLTPEDVGAGRGIDEGWAAASPVQEAQHRADEDALAECLGADVSELQADRATGRSVFVSEDVGNPQYLASAATVYGSTADAHVALDRMGLPATQRCYGAAIAQQILTRARNGLTSITGRSLSVDDVVVRSSTTEPLALSYYRAEDRGHWPVTDDYHGFLLKVTLAAEDAEVDVYTALALFTKGPVAVQLSAQTYFTPPGDLGPVAKQIFDRLPVDPEAQVVGTPELPDPGQQPADAASAEQQIRLAYTGVFDSSSTPEARSRFSERPRVWIVANQQVEAGEYAGFVEGMSAAVDEVVFISPTHAAVRFQLRRPGGSVPQSVDIGDAVLVDGRWLVGIETTCALVSTANVECDMSL